MTLDYAITGTEQFKLPLMFLYFKLKCAITLKLQK